MLCANVSKLILGRFMGQNELNIQGKKREEERKKEFSLQFCCLNNHVLVFCGEKKLALMRGKRTEM